MFFTSVLAKKVKSKAVLVLLESVATGHKKAWKRERVADKLELVLKDPYVQQEVVYKEVKKIKSI
ncbi:39S ribosomal protein L33, mitochondrial [Orchesella cincta]|uniref:39S ribosomal protein L33, mitochondrial n=1 Tax=Orchesella cincta TaxID=48709 RepID=A0A1D2MN44_ORCCI|nr:39S ribosomal protein L33, mitochondrial [Orchesella cincta]